jgi:Peptidase S46
MMKCVLFVLAGLAAWPAAADEGLWPFNQFPTDTVKEKREFAVTDAFLDNLRLASVRIADGAGSFVSPNGLLLTNQHLVAGCIPNVEEGFLASAKTPEVKCAGLEAGVLLSIEDVTTKVKGTGDKGTHAIEQRNAAIAGVERQCAAKSGNSCSVMKLFSGGRYDLYEYKKYSDVRLVFAPERALAFFGRERDSITYLRYGLDIAFLRAYENGKPAATPHFLKWSAETVKDGDLVFAEGDPAPTARATTAAQLTFYRDTALPLLLGRLGPRIQKLNAFSNKSEAQATLTELLEAYKTSAGKLIGLRDDRLVLRKTSFDSKIRKAVERDPKLGTAGGKVWDDVAAAYKTWGPLEKPYEILEGAPAPGSKLFRIARQIVRGETPDAGPVASDAVETLMIAQYLEELKNLGDKHAPVKALLGGKTSQQAAEGYVSSSKLRDPAERRKATGKSEDGMIRLATILEEPSRKIGKRHDEVIGALEASAAEKIAGYRLQLFGAADYPDGTSTPRVSYGVLKGYTDRAGVAQPFADTFSGLFYRRTKEEAYQVPKRWVDAKDKLDEVTPLDFVSTCDIGGGQPGSPTVNRGGELVGVIFDGNLESLPGTYLYTDEQARAVHVAVQGITQALDNVYQARELLGELGIARTLSHTY